MKPFFGEMMLERDYYGSLIGGKELRGKENELVSPVTGSCWKRIVNAGPSDVSAAIAAAALAFKSDRATAFVRADRLRRVADLMKENSELLANAIVMEMGKPVCEAEGEVVYAASYFSWYAGEAERIYGTAIPSRVSDKRLMLSYVPVGVCGIITPWNFPLAMVARKLAAALAAGCTAVIKPSSETPVSGILLGLLCQEAGFPDGAVNVVAGDEVMIGRQLLDSPLVKKISFTGSCAVGEYLYRESAATMKKLTMELGGQAPLLVFEDADLSVAVEESIKAKFRNNGQTCVCANRFLVHETVADAFSSRLAAAATALKVGDPRDRDTEISKVLHPASAKKVRLHIDDALKKGASLIAGDKDGLGPTVLTRVDKSMSIFNEETFGPVAPLITFGSFDEALALANASSYGLAAYLFTRNLTLAYRAAEELEYGIIGINDGMPSAAEAVFGGVKGSGLGREGGPVGIKEYLVEKYLSLAL